MAARMTRSYLGIDFSERSREELRPFLEQLLVSGKPNQIVTANPEMLLAARRDPKLLETIRHADLVTADGFGLVLMGLASERARITGNDLADILADLCLSKQARLVLFGGAGDVAIRAADILRNRVPNLDVVGIPAGDVQYVSGAWELDKNRIQALSASEPTVLLVALGHGKQELWIRDHLADLPTLRIAVGVGGVLDVLAGEVSRAPEPMRRYGYEWLWRVMRQPARIVRILRAVLLFPAVVFWDKLRALWMS
jgi:N-acetylglucosaminyldiphosphoundecaprenol N-acetyl-beta-D-mannosaminyltransferase